MKKLSCLLMVLAMAIPALGAGNIVLTATDNSDGTCTISFVATGAAPVGVGLDVDVLTGGPITAVGGIDSFFDIFLDAAYEMETTTPGSYTYGAGAPIALQDAAGVDTLPSASFAISMGGLGGAAAPLNPAPMSGTLAVLTAGDDTTGTIGLNVKRGGIVDVNGEAMTTNLPLAFTITVSAACYGDVNGNGFTNPQDVSALVAYLNVNAAPPFYSIPSTSPAFDASKDVNGNGFVNPQDVSALVAYLNVNATPPFYSIPCP